ncbi:MAG: DUF6537 domain-containing protein, partial [Pseudomonadota bacterium]
WTMAAFRVLASLRGLRGGPLDVFARTEERRMERQLVADYESVMAEVLERLSPETHGLAVALAEIPEKIRGFGHVKERHVAEAKISQEELLAQLRAPEPVPQAAE